MQAPAAHVLKGVRMFRLNSGSHDAIKKKKKLHILQQI